MIKEPHVSGQDLISGRMDICCPWIFYSKVWPVYLVPGIGAYAVVANSFNAPVSAQIPDQRF